MGRVLELLSGSHPALDDGFGYPFPVNGGRPKSATQFVAGPTGSSRAYLNSSRDFLADSRIRPQPRIKARRDGFAASPRSFQRGGHSNSRRTSFNARCAAVNHGGTTTTSFLSGAGGSGGDAGKAYDETAEKVGAAAQQKMEKEFVEEVTKQVDAQLNELRDAAEAAKAKAEANDLVNDPEKLQGVVADTIPNPTRTYDAAMALDQNMQESMGEFAEAEEGTTAAGTALAAAADDKLKQLVSDVTQAADTAHEEIGKLADKAEAGLQGKFSETGELLANEAGHVGQQIADVAAAGARNVALTGAHAEKRLHETAGTVVEGHVLERAHALQGGKPLVVAGSEAAGELAAEASQQAREQLTAVGGSSQDVGEDLGAAAEIVLQELQAAVRPAVATTEELTGGFGDHIRKTTSEADDKMMTFAKGATAKIMLEANKAEAAGVEGAKDAALAAAEGIGKYVAARSKTLASHAQHDAEAVAAKATAKAELLQTELLTATKELQPVVDAAGGSLQDAAKRVGETVHQGALDAVSAAAGINGQELLKTIGEVDSNLDDAAKTNKIKELVAGVADRPSVQEVRGAVTENLGSALAKSRDVAEGAAQDAKEAGSGALKAIADGARFMTAEGPAKAGEVLVMEGTAVAQKATMEAEKMRDRIADVASGTTENLQETLAEVENRAKFLLPSTKLPKIGEEASPVVQETFGNVVSTDAGLELPNPYGLAEDVEKKVKASSGTAKKLLLQTLGLYKGDTKGPLHVQYFGQRPENGWTYENLGIDRAAAYRDERQYRNPCQTGDIPDSAEGKCELVREPGHEPQCYRTAEIVKAGEECNCDNLCADPPVCPNKLCQFEDGKCELTPAAKVAEDTPPCACEKSEVCTTIPPLCPAEYNGKELCAKVQQTLPDGVTTKDVCRPTGASGPFKCSCEGVCDFPECAEEQCGWRRPPPTPGSPNRLRLELFCDRTDVTRRDNVKCKCPDALCGGLLDMLGDKTNAAWEMLRVGPFKLLPDVQKVLEATRLDQLLETGGAAAQKAKATLQVLFGLKDDNEVLKVIDETPVPKNLDKVVDAFLAFKHGLDTVEELVKIVAKLFFLPGIQKATASPLLRNPTLRGATPDILRDFLLMKSGALQGGMLEVDSLLGPGSAGVVNTWSDATFGRVRRAVKGLMSMLKAKAYNVWTYRTRESARAYRERLLKPEFFPDSRRRQAAVGDVQRLKGPHGEEYPYGAVRKPFDRAEQPDNTSNEPQLLLFHKSKSIVDTDITNSNFFSCWQTAETTPVRPHAHPFIRFDRPLHRIHVKVRDTVNADVKWDAIYNLEGYTVLKPNAPALGGTRPDFWTFCVPPDEPLPHTFSVDVSLVGSGFNKLKKEEAFVGSMLVNAFTPRHAPEGHAMPMPMRLTTFDPNPTDKAIMAHKENEDWLPIEL